MKVTKLLIATRNQAKFAEAKLLLSDFPLQLCSLSDVRIAESPGETGRTFEENAIIKARYYGGLANLPTLSDDGGLEIDELGGWPGVYSRRMFGLDKPEASDEEMIVETLRRLQGVASDRRGCSFSFVMALFVPPSAIYTGSGSVRGMIPYDPCTARVAGFPFRSIFYLPSLGKTVAELSPEGQARFMNHRKTAILQLEPYLRELASYA